MSLKLIWKILVIFLYSCILSCFNIFFSTQIDMLFPSVTRTNPKAIYQIFKKNPQKTMVLSNDLGIVLPEEVIIAVFNRMKEWHLCTIRLKKVQHWLRNINPNFWYRHKDISSLPELTGRRIRRYFYKMCGWRNGNLQLSGSLHP